MNAGALFRRAAVLLVLLGLAAFAVADRNAWYLIVGGVLTVASTSVTEGPRGRYLPNSIVSIGIVGAMVWGALQVLDQPGMRGVGGIVGGVVLAILVLKLYGRKDASDWRQILALTVVMVIAAALNSVDLLAGLLVMAYSGTALAAVMLYQMYAGARTADDERRAALELMPGGTVAVRQGVLPAVPVTSGVHAMRHFRRMVVLAALTGLAMSMVVFLLFPRDAVLGDRWQGRGRQSGFSDEVVLLSNDRIALSAREVFSVRMLDPQGIAGEYSGPLHLRGAVLDVYNPTERRWVAGDRRAYKFSTALGAAATGGFTFFAPDALDVRMNVWTQVVSMRSLATPTVFSMWLPLSIATPDGRAFVLNTQTGVIREESRESPVRPWSYSVRVQPFPSPGLVQAVCPGSTPQASVTFPVLRMVELADELLAQSGMTSLPTREEADADPALKYERNRRIARWFSEYLSKSGFTYTTDLSRFRQVHGEDPNVSFLTRYRFGHCEFFASALAGLCLSSGVEARVVTGYLAHEYDRGSAEYVVREANAHAWVEVRTGEWQWVIFDPSPAEALMAAQSANRGWLDSFRWVLDPLEFAWQSRVVNFDSGAQAEIMQKANDRMQTFARSAAEWVTDAGARINRTFRLGSAGYLWLGLVAVVLVIAVIAIVVTMRRDRQVRQLLGGAHGHALHRARLGRDAAFYLDALAVLAAHGLEKPRWRTPQMHVVAVRATAGARVAEPLEAIVERFYRIRYAGARPRRAERTADAALVTALRAALSHGYTQR